MFNTILNFNLSQRDGYNYNLALKAVRKGSETKSPKPTKHMILLIHESQTRIGIHPRNPFVSNPTRRNGNILHIKQHVG